MNHQNVLIRRKEYFGLLWLAAHHPSKLNRTDIIKMDLSAKCKEITEYIINGQAKRPRFSLLVLSHLMYGLVVVLNKKNTYLYNELVSLKSMLNVYQTDLKKSSKTLKKVKAADRKSITLKENIPDVFDEFSLETMELDRQLEQMNFIEANMQLRNNKKITIDDSEDIIERSTIITLDNYNYEADFFGDFIDFTDRKLLETTARSSLQKRLSKNKEKNEKTPFRDLTNGRESVPRDAQPSRIDFDDETTIMHENEFYNKKQATTTIEQESLLNPMPDQQFEMPNLFQETVNQETLLPPPAPIIDTGDDQQHHTFTSQIEDVVFPDKDDGATHQTKIPKSISGEIKEMKLNKTKKTAAKETAKEKAVAKKKKILIDNVTEIPTSEIRKRITKYETEQEQDVERNKLFREKNLWLLTRNDYFLTDEQLLTAPFSSDTRRTNFPMSDYSFFKRYSMRNQLVLNSKLLTSSRVQDDTYSYLTEARDRALAIETGQPFEQQQQQQVLETPLEINQQEIQRKLEDGSRDVSNIAKGSSTKRKPSARDSYISNISNQMETAEQQILDQTNQPNVDMASFQQNDMSLPQMGPLDSFMDTASFIQNLPEQPSNVAAAAAAEPDNFEQIILDCLAESSNGSIILQDLMINTILPHRFLQTQKPRRYFAAKIFVTSLKMCGQKKIQLTQTEHYGPINTFLI